jgi:hypothetical protein
MIDKEQEARAEILARLKTSRDELRQLLDPPPHGTSDEQATRPGVSSEGFPRSRTMRALMSSKGLTTLGAAAAGLLVARPALALRLLRMLPASAFARMLLVRAVTAFRSGR